MQCRDSVDTTDDCISHDVTNVNSLIVDRTNGTVLTLVVWQDQDDVLNYQILAMLDTVKPTGGSKSEKHNTLEITKSN